MDWRRANTSGDNRWCLVSSQTISESSRRPRAPIPHVFFWVEVESGPNPYVCFNFVYSNTYGVGQGSKRVQVIRPRLVPHILFLYLHVLYTYVCNTFVCIYICTCFVWQHAHTRIARCIGIDVVFAETWSQSFTVVCFDCRGLKFGSARVANRKLQWGYGSS